MWRQAGERCGVRPGEGVGAGHTGCVRPGEGVGAGHTGCVRPGEGVGAGAHQVRQGPGFEPTQDHGCALCVSEYVTVNTTTWTYLGAL